MNPFKKYLILTALSLTILSCQNYPDASDVLVETTYALSGFDRISANSAFEVYASYGETFSVSITVNEDQLDNLDVSVSGGELRIEYSSPEEYNNLQFTADITLPELNRVHLYDRGVIFFYDRAIGADSRSAWTDSFSEAGKTLEILLDGEYSHASFDMEVPPLPEGTFYLYSRSDFSAYNRAHTINAKELVIHSEADSASSTVTLRSTIQPELMIVQADHYGTLSMKDLKVSELFVQLDYYRNRAYVNTARFMGAQSDRVAELREAYGLTSGGYHSRDDSYVSSFSSLYYKYGSGSPSNVKVLSSTAVKSTY